jgi:hypothetical protein
MKLFFLSLSFLLNQAASADSFTIIRDGQEYLCEQTTPTNPGGAAECANKAYNGPFSREESARLCAGARNTAPADCALKSYAGPFSKEESLQLCTRARTIGPADCATKAYAGPFSKAESLDLCSGNTTEANATCAIKAYQGPYSKEEAIRMCKNQPLLVLRSLQLIEQSAELKPVVESIKSKLNMGIKQ